MFSYRALLKQAVKISWQHKYLWFFGLFASLLSAGGGWQILNKNMGDSLKGDAWAGLSNIFEWEFFYQSIKQGLAVMFHQDWLFALDNILIMLLIAVFFIFFLWLSVASQGGLIDHIYKIIKHKDKKNSPKLMIKDGLHAGNHKFWPLFGLNIIFKVLINFSFIIISIPFLFLVITDSAFLATSYVLLFLIFIPIAIGLNLLVRYAMAYNIIGHYSFIESIENAWRLFIRNWLVSMEMLITLFLINFLAGIALLLLMAIFILPLLIVGVTFALNGLALVMMIIAIIIIALTGSLLATFENAGWISLFVRLEEKGGQAKVERIFSKKKTKK